MALVKLIVMLVKNVRFISKDMACCVSGGKIGCKWRPIRGLCREASRTALHASKKWQCIGCLSGLSALMLCVAYIIPRPASFDDLAHGWSGSLREGRSVSHGLQWRLAECQGGV
ncbi:hypothetical protein HBH56_159540 [Parastagonospora nodorum]|uniref:Uncharacterized protein n=1 Tax=Phaeosphaeria nodorum (strain SN15 / ATCC MYA-4574 / FGSC 10173) TaxID=321614 RepID=A0A7U2F263_PHANO|nr:hypothetical protein HBH56_159540 [Parastagonospora nodorum]QRC97298.1 hypothetical protein JI435_410430 [Parastagonospora nodorum SN15]KAH3922437.1 hypothetical protein HBH54_223970 [Parastagonospora nodorum]KAH3973689.1 hypothetical protein HBH51_095600 [Parastagonospora nodorum]KAH4118852.1 hypothetical protein HBH47_133870 [Parastagonospora nodorum]